MTGYVLRGGRPGYDRLVLLARERWADARVLLEHAGVSVGMRCADIGCGGGEVTMEIARLVAPGGGVVGIDVDKVKIALARQAAAERGLGNVEFTALDVSDWDEPAAYDVVHSRFLLQHLSRPDSLLRRMWAAVTEGGVLIVEDADFDGWYCEASADAIVSAGVATPDQVTAALDSLRRFTDDPRTLICGPRVFQLWSRR